MSIERLQREHDDAKLMVETILNGILKDIKDTPNDSDLGKKIRAYKRPITKLNFIIKKL